MMRTLGLVLSVVGLLAFGCGGDDDDDGPTVDAAPQGENFTVTMTAADEVPVCDGAASTAAGSATVAVNGARTEITVHAEWSGLSGTGNAGAAHIHAGADGVAGGVALAFSAAGTAPSNPTDITFTAADYAAPAGGPADFPAFVASLLAGNAYVNVHTTACAMGEIRGQIAP